MTKLKSLPKLPGLLALALTLTAVSAQGGTLAELYDKVPNPPEDAAIALSWVKDGKVVQPEIVAIHEALAKEHAQIAEANGGTMPTGAEPVPANLNDTAEVKAAAKNYSFYLMKNQGDKEASKALSKRKRWLQAAYGRLQKNISAEMTPCDDPCTDEAILTANEPHLQKRNQTVNNEFKAWNSLFDDWKKTKLKDVMSADASFSATMNGEAATTAEGKSMIANYRAAMLKEVSLLLSITELSVLRAEAIIKGMDGPESDALSGATKKADK